MDYLIMKITKDELLGRRGGGTKNLRPKIFVAFRMNVKSSVRFREELESALLDIGKVTVLDGRVEDGVPWAPEIRKRIKSSQLVVADVTGPSKEVIFELGVSGGKSYLPVVETDDRRDRLPDWLTALQIPTFEGPGTAQIAESAWVRVSSPGARGASRPPAVPGSIIWLQNEDSDWCVPIFDRFQNLCNERSLTVAQLFPDDLTSSDDLRAHLRAWLIVGCLDGGIQDYATHYFAGDVVSRPRCGSGSGAGQKVGRGMVLLGEEDDILKRCMADSVNRVAKSLIGQANCTNFFVKVTGHLDRYRRWLKEKDL